MMRAHFPIFRSAGRLWWVGVVVASVLWGCAGAQIPQIPEPSPAFHWEPPAKAQSQNVNIALVSPRFGGEARFRPSRYSDYEKSQYLSMFLDSVQTDLQRTLLAKGFAVTGPFETFNVMTFPEKKDAPLALVPEFVVVVDERYASEFQNESGNWTKLNGTMAVSGFARFTVIEPISEQKIWVKKIDIPSQSAPIEVDLMYTSGRLNQFNTNKDNRGAVFVGLLNAAYPEVMQKFWNYLNPEEMEMMRKASMDARARKTF